MFDIENINGSCTRCHDEPGKMQICPGDGRLHHHGQVHWPEIGLVWIGDKCLADLKDLSRRLREENQRKQKAA